MSERLGRLSNEQLAEAVDYLLDDLDDACVLSFGGTWKPSVGSLQRCRGRDRSDLGDVQQLMAQDAARALGRRGDT